ncbi:MAG TPA: putative LPS assembly protein LptD [Chitinophagaceae bacterium]|nr:putative LPS assembly protein LptD [Chitinophagaceae bacterium]
MILHKFRSNYLFAGLLTAIFFTQTWKSTANYSNHQNFYIALTAQLDTVPQKNKDSLIKQLPISAADTSRRDSLSKINALTDTSIVKVDTFDLKLSKDTLDAPVEYEAEDSVVVLIKDKKVVLYGKAKMHYKDIDLTAPKMELDQQTQILTAFKSVDSAGDLIDRAHFSQGETKFQSDTIRYNFKTQKGLTKSTFTMMNELVMYAEKSKRVGNVLYARRGVLSTCNLDDPHFGFRYDKIKVVNNKVAITGPIHPEFEGVPIPIYLPFGFFPMNKGRHSGILAPTFTANEDFGLGLEGLGYYKVLSPYFDVTVRTNLYSYGGWTFNVVPTYRKRYRYQGQMNFSVQNTKYNFKGDPDYVVNKSYSIQWSHSSDSRARPGTSFSANVNAGSTTYNQYVPNNVNRNFQNQLGSSITYSKTFKNSNLTVSANHNQNNSLHLINLNLPDIGYSLNTLYPFQRKAEDMTGAPKWYDKLGFGYNGNVRSQVSFYDTAVRVNDLLDTLQWGGKHNFPITLSLPPIFGGRFLVSPNISYENTWIAEKVRRKWNSTLDTLETTVTKGFYVDHRASFGIGINTALYGTFNFKGPKQMAIRHVVRPTVSFSYSPSLSKAHWYKTQIDTTGRLYSFAEFERSLFGYYGPEDFGGISFGVDNNLEMKMRSKKDTTIEKKKIRLIDGFGFNGSYNFIADSFKLTPINFYLRSSLFDKINITASTTLNPYQFDSLGRPVSEYAWQGEKFSLGRFTNGSLSMSTDFKSKPRDEKKAQERKQMEQQLLNDPLLATDAQSQLDYMRRNPADFVDFNIPWSISLSLSVYYSERFRVDRRQFEKEFSSNLNFNGSFSLTPKWNFSMNGYYDFETKNLQTFTMSINREMHCWQLSINVTPVGPYRYFSFTISPKSGMLQDLKVNRTRYFYGD